MSEIGKTIAGFAGNAWGWLTSAKYWLAVVMAVGVLCFLKGCDVGKDLKAAEFIEAERAARHTSDLSAGQAAGERASETKAIGEAQAGRDAAIEAAPGGSKPSAKSNALNCQRLRQSHTASQLKTHPVYQKHCVPKED